MKESERGTPEQKQPPKKVEEPKVPKLRVEKQTIILDVLRSDLVDVKPSPDGIIFELKGGLSLILVEMGMPLSVKNVIKSTIDRIGDKDLIVNLMNYEKPIQIFI